MWRIQEYLTCSATSQNFVVPILNERQFPSIEHHAASRVVKNELFATAAIPRDLTQLAADQIACQDSFWCQSDQVSVLEYIYLRYFAIKMRLEDDALACRWPSHSFHNNLAEAYVCKLKCTFIRHSLHTSVVSV